MITSVLTREGTTESITQNSVSFPIYVVEVYSLSGLPQSSQSLTDLEIVQLGQSPDSGTAVPPPSESRHSITSPQYRVLRNMRSRHQAKVRVTWGSRFFSGGGVIATQGQRSSSRDELTLQPYLRSEIVDQAGSPVSVIVLDYRRVERLITRTTYRRLLPNEISIEVANGLVEANRRRLYTIGGSKMILERHDIVPANQTQVYIDTVFLSKSAMPAVPVRDLGSYGIIYPVAALPVLGEYVEPIPYVDTSTAVDTAEDLYGNGGNLPWL